MSQKDDSENDIWEYKPVGKKKKTQESLSAVTAVTKRRCAFRNTCKRNTADTVKTPERTVKVNKDGDTRSETHTPNPKALCIDRHIQTGNAVEGPSSGDFCPMCQMPFSVLVVQTHRWHVAECLDTPRDKCKECPDGLQCSSTIPNHYKNFNHTLLAHSRAHSDTALLSVSQQAGTSSETSCSPLPGLQNKKANGSDLETSQDSIVSNSNTRTPPSKLTKGLLFLRSPGPDDLKKKKGWSRSADGHKSTSASQESKTDLTSTPIKEDNREQACENSLNSDQLLENDDTISYSPLSEFPSETEVNKKINFNENAFENEDKDSVELFSDDFSSEDELLTQFIDNMGTGNVSVRDLSSSNTQLESVTSLAPTDLPTAAIVAGNTADSMCGKDSRAKASISLCNSSIQSPQSIVLERLRETLIRSESPHFRNLHDTIQAEQPHTDSRKVPSSQTSALQRSKTMPPQKGQSKGGQVSCLKQTDIGVFFGLKPLKEKEADLSSTSGAVLGENSGQIRQRRERRERPRKNKTDTTTDTSQGAVTVDSSNTVSSQGEARGGWNRGWRRRNRSDGEVQLRRCPFYKKIPGTKFAVDAFQYGEIQGITGYFLTHFHSDHYTGLTKNSTFPIYCNKITGNLVKSKLKVAEKYVHILPMNTQVTVEGVMVTLLDANHCPGAAMLLFFLPDGQIVLHTGDFRADPSMETYPELLSCRVQTLYLDTTYCSPEYTFPRQQEVISFAASTAFELVTLNPRTLVVCGSYSVGKEKVFLALAEVLGTKVCLSKDKYNTMCCLESEQVRQSITTDWKAAQVHVLPMMQLSFNKLQCHLERFSDRYDQLVAFKPTGWTFSQQVQSVEDIEPQINGNISIYGIPYSEHSSYLELKRFVQWLQPLKIIPTVNNGSWASRKAMEKCFSEWLMETRAKL